MTPIPDSPALKAAVPDSMLVVLLTDDGNEFKVMRRHGSVVDDVTDQYELHHIALSVDGKILTGFHVGKRS